MVLLVSFWTFPWPHGPNLGLSSFASIFGQAYSPTNLFVKKKKRCTVNKFVRFYVWFSFYFYTWMIFSYVLILSCYRNNTTGRVIHKWGGKFDRTVKLWECVDKIILGSGLEPVTSWQKLTVERTGEPGIQMERLIGRSREGLNFFVFLVWEEWRDDFLAGSPVKKEGQLVAFSVSLS